MFMDFGSLRPEITSARMYSGPGSGPMLAAAAAWDGLAAELQTTAAGYTSVTSQLTTGPWLGSASAAMTASATPYVAWLNATAGQAEQAATQARAAAAAYEAARAMTVPPLVIAANRALQASLVATNILGQNAPAIAATESHYANMWAQDAVAMYGYAGTSATASKVAPFTPPPATSNPDGLAGLSRLTPAIPAALQQLASPGSTWDALLKLRDDLDLHLLARWGSTITSVISTGKSLAPAVKAVESGVKGSGSALGAALGPLLGSAGTAGAPVAASLGRATSLGALSVPPSWVATGSATSSTAAALPASGGWNAVPVSGPAGPAGVPLMPITGMGGNGSGRLADAARFLSRPNMLPRWPAGG